MTLTIPKMFFQYFFLSKMIQTSQAKKFSIMTRSLT